MSQHSVVNVQTFINEQPFGKFQWLVFSMCFVIVLLDGFDTASIGFIAPSLLAEWHLGKPELAPVLSAALFGLAFGSLAAGPLSDRLGRRGLLLGAVILFGTACLGSAFTVTLNTLTVLRFVTGLGLGAAMPNAVTLMSEFCPDRRRSTVINLMFCGFPLGAACGGFLAAWMIPHFGWRSVLILGGVTPLLLAVLLAAKMPESVRFMVANVKPHALVQQTLARVSRAALDAERFVLSENAPDTGRRGLGVVLSKSYIVGSVMLWVAYFMGLVIFYASINWMPLLLKDAGLAPKSATLISALFPLGGVGAVLCGALMDRLNANRVVAICYALTAVSVYAIGQLAGNVGALVLVVFLAGILMNTAQSSLPALAAALYPTAGRGTGVAWMLGIGRFGGIAGSFLVAELTRRHFGFADVFSTVAIAGVIACIALAIKQMAAPRAAAAAGTIETVGH
ncbi:MFS transporter [Paraburkholderia tagetis]|uniref:MFS transporter n=1 Tax=Paraburkholderia tagetis TaxID=2913261 RepID=A0A9X1RMJ8_9BURK|nr:MFS transporter [Paraburkholderia tagetis]MCG5074128.1 MFS transporter [Paraburkholderia tagetis]